MPLCIISSEAIQTDCFVVVALEPGPNARIAVGFNEPVRYKRKKLCYERNHGKHNGRNSCTAGRHGVVVQSMSCAHVGDSLIGSFNLFFDTHCLVCSAEQGLRVHALAAVVHRKRRQLRRVLEVPRAE